MPDNLVKSSPVELFNFISFLSDIFLAGFFLVAVVCLADLESVPVGLAETTFFVVFVPFVVFVLDVVPIACAGGVFDLADLFLLFIDVAFFLD